MKPFINSTPFAETPVLVCLDLQRENASGLSAADAETVGRCIDACKRVLRHARALGWRVAHVQRHDGRISTLPELFRPIEGLEPRPSEPVFYRERPSAYASPAFKEFVQRQCEPKLVLIGFSLHASVLFTAVSSLEQGVPVTLVEGALATSSRLRLSGDLLESVLFGVLGSFAEVITPDELLDVNGSLLLHAANHP